MGLFSVITRYNLVALLCACFSIVAFVLNTLSFFLPWVENKDYLKEEAMCNSIFPPLNGISLQHSCVKTHVWDDTVFQVANYTTSVLLFITLIITIISILFDCSQMNKRKCICFVLPQNLKYLSILSFFINFVSLNIFMFIFFKDTQKLTEATSGSLVEVSWGFWCSFFSSLILLLAGFINVSFSSPPIQKRVFIS
ncbi:hypothetical protein ENUP19_0083G0058 [Entamoeba nuttalli]|uniref:Transmembrane protein n=2 Tax=Entamoeba nuttalli TaxID=412467 RepID=K2HYW9_ENTNP|nr:hypothetical protein ENU1_049850 [Entamoeba nuttalli P19]EKE41615.1 hypothetical protein ENU1_049850 [Entamoeba nuttalli P19]|eukprot:XP_008856049.1 hypothetical protein ENU1_049850 [Entamoeba nuttalli P19]